MQLHETDHVERSSFNEMLDDENSGEAPEQMATLTDDQTGGCSPLEQAAR